MLRSHSAHRRTPICCSSPLALQDLLCNSPFGVETFCCSPLSINFTPYEVCMYRTQGIENEYEFVSGFCKVYYSVLAFQALVYGLSL